jgi:hypothetical protein
MGPKHKNSTAGATPQNRPKIVGATPFFFFFPRVPTNQRWPLRQSKHLGSD